jgi:hypothetical protein
MPGFIDRTGQRFGKFVAICATGEKTFNGRHLWLCRCDCGREEIRDVTIMLQRIKRGGEPCCRVCFLSKQAVDISGQRFGKLIAIEYAGPSPNGNIWRFRCDCGEVIERPLANIRTTTRQEGIPSCPNCIGVKDITGQTFGLLTAVRKEPSRGNNRHWVYRCKCGREVVRMPSTIAVQIKNGILPCCGHRECGGMRNMDGKSALRALMYAYKSAAKERGYEFLLSEKEFEDLSQKDCFYCGVGPNQVYTGGKSTLIYNGLDRIDNLKGYIPGNVVAACGRCNKAKNNMPYDVFMAWIDRLVKQRMEGKI